VRLAPGRTMVTYQPTIWLQSYVKGPTVGGASFTKFVCGGAL
jgi:hypothetical protein